MAVLGFTCTKAAVQYFISMITPSSESETALDTPDFSGDSLQLTSLLRFAASLLANHDLQLFLGFMQTVVSLVVLLLLLCYISCL